MGCTHADHMEAGVGNDEASDIYHIALSTLDEECPT